MFKKIAAVTVLTTSLLLGGAFQQTADASSEPVNTNAKVYYKVYYQVNGQWGTSDQNKVKNADYTQWLNEYIQHFLGQKLLKIKEQLKVEQPKQEQLKQEQPKVEQPKQEQPKQEQPKVEQPKQEQPKVEQPKQEQPKQEQPKVEQPKQEQPQAQQPAPQQPTEPTPKVEQPTQSASHLNQFEQQVVELTNQERAKHGLAPLKELKELSQVAREKSRDMAVNGYFDHQSPTYGSPFDMMKSFGITYRTAGENIAKGQRTPQEVVNAWMNSPGHRANILNANFTHIGVGYVEQGNHWTQQFIGR